jgi:enoyl-CoA hydratase
MSSLWESGTGHIGVEDVRGVAVITLNRPESLNALSSAMRAELAQIIRAFGDGSRCRGLVLTGTGRAFSAGEDLYEAGRRSEQADWLTASVELFHDLTRAALATRVPFIAAVNGIAIGGAAELTLCLDRRVAAQEAEYFFPENHLGLTISNASSYLLPRLVGRRAADLILSARRLDATEAQAYGLIDEVVSGDVVEAAIDVIDRWAPPGSATQPHLTLLRPSVEAVEAAFVAETAVVDQIADIAVAGLGRFAGRARVEGAQS